MDQRRSTASQQQFKFLAGEKEKGGKKKTSGEREDKAKEFATPAKTEGEGTHFDADRVPSSQSPKARTRSIDTALSPLIKEIEMLTISSEID